MMSLPHHFVETFWAVLPIIAILFIFQVGILKQKIPHLQRIVVGFILVWIGLTFLIIGLEKALFPLGKIMATQLTSSDLVSNPKNWYAYYWVYIFAGFIGFATTIAEPSLLAVAIKANQVSGGFIKVKALRVTVAIGVAIGIALGSFRIVTGLPLHYFIIGGYILVLIQTYFSPKSIIALAYDAGGVTTSIVTVPIIAALGLGLSSAIDGRNPLTDGFGLIAFASLFPIMSVLAYVQIINFYNHDKPNQ
ncbi:DUF1538 domain-containing protein [Candidatus Thioglobus sp.]|jgi:hypothetical protein|uniref:DUF1538 domain-containing protein n=1 Tax=Candidatus Thioglobus sp. TaxID=2026721 RepID=UPI0025C48CB7|nr:DUF1538 domain-containing protein [Candidatus Thioglobus sp.]